MWAQTENTQPASLDDLMVWFHANNWDTGLYHAGSYAAGVLVMALILCG